ncbi:MAG: hypothetical protein H0W88_06850 [Parachlamydiaceae bacterium]|nr:hypothetical protein [Parachlamydiaceae bacterium]
MNTDINSNNQIARLKEDVELLSKGLQKNSHEDIPNFNGRFIDLLPGRSLWSRTTEKLVGMVPTMIKPLQQTGMAHREVLSKLTEFQVDKLSKNDQKFVEFNLGPSVPYYKLTLGENQRNALAKLLKDPDKYTDNLKGLAAKYLAGNYLVSDLTEGERYALDLVNFQATQDFFVSMALMSKNSKSILSKFSKNETRYNYGEAVVAEVLSKALGYNQSLEGKTIDLPVHVGRKGIMKLMTFTIKKEYLGEKLPYYVLEPIDKPVSKTASYANESEIEKFGRGWVVIRGTEPMLKEDKEGVQEALLADLADTEGVSALPIWHRSDKLLASLSKLAKADETGIHKPFNITGHSLGGTLAQSLGVIYNPLTHKTYAFNSPGVDAMTHSLYEKMGDKIHHPGHLNYKQNKLVVFHHKGDILSSVSPKKIGHNFEIRTQPLHREKSDAFLKHADLMLNSPHSQKEVDLVKDEKNFMRRVTEWGRNRVLSKAIHLLVNSNEYGWYKNKEELREFGSKYLKHVDDVEKTKGKK